MRQPCRITPTDGSSRQKREDERRGHSVAFLLLQGSLYAVSPTSIYRCQTRKEGSSSSVFMLLMLMNLRPICHRMGVCNFSLQYHDEKRETCSGKGSERKRERERKKENVEKSLNFIILLGADLMRTTPLPLQNPRPRQWHPPNPHATTGHGVPPKFLPLSSAAICTYQKYLGYWGGTLPQPRQTFTWDWAGLGRLAAALSLFVS